MESTAALLQSCLTALQRQTAAAFAAADFRPRIAVVLGSGLGFFADRLQTVCTVPYTQIPDFPVSTVAGHEGRFVFGRLDGVDVAAMQGRVHLYEGYTPAQVVLPLRLLRLLGAQTLILTNAAGGIDPAFEVGDPMLITDHIACFAPSALVGPNLESLGPRFPDMSQVYDPALCGAVREAAQAEKIRLREGVYLQTVGPQYETPAEIRMFRSLGADAVGMSTAIEACAARHAGMRVCGLSLITNAAAGVGNAELNHEEVKRAAAQAGERLFRLVRRLILAADLQNK